MRTLINVSSYYYLLHFAMLIWRLPLKLRNALTEELLQIIYECFPPHFLSSNPNCASMASHVVEGLEDIIKHYGFWKTRCESLRKDSYLLS